MWFLQILLFGIVVVMGVVTGLTPMYSRQSTPFGVSVEGKNPFIDERKKRFAIWNITISILFGLPFFIFPFLGSSEEVEMWSSIYSLVSIFGFILVSFILYLKYRKEVLDWRESQPKVERQQKKVVVDLMYREKLETKSHFTFFFWQAVITGVTIAIVFLFYNEIPNEIPMQWDINFEVNRSIEKSLWAVLSLPLMQILMIPVFNYSHYAIIQSKQKLSPLDPKGASENSRRFRKAWSDFLFYTTIGTQLLLSGLALYSYFGEHIPVVVIMIGVFIYLIFTIGGSIYLTVKYGQAGEKLLDEPYYADAEDDENWVLGMFYVNKDEPSIFVEKRFGIGTTINYGNPKAWIFILGLVIFTVLILVWSLMLG